MEDGLQCEERVDTQGDLYMAVGYRQADRIQTCSNINYESITSND